MRFPRLFDSFVADHFGFRNALLRLHSYVTVRLLGVSPSPAVEAVVGKAGWYYHTGDRAIVYLEGRNLFSNAELASWRRAFRQRSQWLARKGIRYMVVFAPAKASIYPEYLPRWVRPSSRGTRLDQIVAATKGCPNLELVDLRPALLKAKRRMPVYQPTDTHWNAIGAYVAYHEIMGRLTEWFPQAQPLPFSDFNLTWRKNPGGDLAVMLDVQGLRSEMRPLVVNNHGSVFRSVPSGDYASLRRWHRGQLPMVTESTHASIPRVVVFRDSFAIALVPFLSEQFGRAVYLWSPDLDPVVIERERPNLVIQECAERMLSVLSPTNPPEIEAEQIFETPVE